jgi:hydantoinase/carbamoylase family amidase
VPTQVDRAGRVCDRLDRLFEIGRAAGTNRPGLGDGEQRAFDLVAGWMEAAGLDVSFDPAGNLLGLMPGSDPTLAAVMAGSHLDTPPDGGRFDGALGVIAALEAVEAIAAGGGVRRPLEVVAFRLEEGCRFGRGVFGSRAMAGMLEPDEADLTDADGVSLGDAFAALGLGVLPSEGWLEPPASYVEAHIEQGPVLAAAGAPVGLVTSIAGMAGVEVAFDGRRGHAGTVPMAMRADAVGAAARFIQGVHDAARALPDAVATIGRIGVQPAATNTIPGRAELFADVRAPDAGRLQQLVDAVHTVAAESAAETGCREQVVVRWRYEPVPMHPGPTAAIRRAIAGIGLDVVELPSGAGHDATIMGMAGVPTAMLFVRSDAGGVSHAPQESTGIDAVGCCVRVLESTLRELAMA